MKVQNFISPTGLLQPFVHHAEERWPGADKEFEEWMTDLAEWRRMKAQEEQKAAE